MLLFGNAKVNSVVCHFLCQKSRTRKKTQAHKRFLRTYYIHKYINDTPIKLMDTLLLVVCLVEKTQNDTHLNRGSETLHLTQVGIIFLFRFFFSICQIFLHSPIHPFHFKCFSVGIEQQNDVKVEENDEPKNMIPNCLPFKNR